MTEMELRRVMLDMIERMDKKLDEQGAIQVRHGEALARIETKMETFVTREECYKTHTPKPAAQESETTPPDSASPQNIKIFAGKNRIVIPIGVIAAAAAAVVAIIQALS